MEQYIALDALKWVARGQGHVIPFTPHTLNNQVPRQISPSPSPDDEIIESTYENTKEQLDQAIDGSNQVMVSANTFLTLLSDTIEVDRAKVNIIRRKFIQVAEIISIRIEDIISVSTSMGPFLANVTITSRALNSQPYTVGKFLRRDALRIKHVIQGYMIALERKIDCNTMPTEELVPMLEKLGAEEHANPDIA